VLNPSPLAISAAKYSIAMIEIVSKKFVNISEKKLSASNTNDWDLLPLLLAFVTIKLMCAYFATCETAILVFINRPSEMFGRQTVFLQYLKYTLP
jgi:hypothetical protein